MIYLNRNKEKFPFKVEGIACPTEKKYYYPMGREFKIRNDCGNVRVSVQQESEVFLLVAPEELSKWSK